MSILKVKDKDGKFVDIPVISGRPASIKVGEVKLLEPNSEPTIENVGTEYDAIFNFGIPKGEYIVQGENFKLDLSDYAKQKQLDKEIQNRQQKDDDLQSQIKSLASGSPLVANSIEEMTDTTKVYVNTTDGNWYYYNGSKWLSAGVYQSTGIANNSIKYKHLNDEVTEKFYNDNLLIGNKLKNVYLASINRNVVTVTLNNNNNIVIKKIANETKHVLIGLERLIKDHVYEIKMTCKSNVEPTKYLSWWFRGINNNNIDVPVNITNESSYKFKPTTDFKEYTFYLTSKNSIVNETQDYNLALAISSSCLDVNQEIEISELYIRDITEENKKLPKAIVLDTDWWTDVDDAVAIRSMLWAERNGLIDISGICIDAIRNTSVTSLDTFLDYEGRPGLCIGIDKQATDYNGAPSYHQTILDNWSRKEYTSNEDCEDCVQFYRRLLVNGRQKVDIIAIGYPNALSRLLSSPSDNISDLNGAKLIKAKVNKLYMMAGNYPNGSENNFTRTERSRTSGANICNNWPTEIVFLGFEVGQSVVTGNTLATTTGTNDLLYKALVAHGSENGRASWDPMTVLLACLDNENISGYNLVRGTNVVNSSTGVNTFTENKNGKHYYVTKRYPDNWYKHQINSIIEKNAWTSRKLGEQQLKK